VKTWPFLRAPMIATAISCLLQAVRGKKSSLKLFPLEAARDDRSQFV